MQDPYRILGVASDADALMVRRAYQKLARRWHPALRAADREAQTRFKAAVRAYALLSDPDQRRRWDEGRSAKPVERRHGSGRRQAALSTPDLVFSFEELVIELLPAEVAAAPEPRGSGPSLDVASEVAVDFEEAIQGVVVSLSVQRESTCSECAGRSASCDCCDGRGVEVGLERVRVRIPSGVATGDRVRVRGQGNRVVDRQGDLYVTIGVRSHDHYGRQGNDIHSEIPITVVEAALGATIRVPTIHGPVEVQVPPGTRSGQRFRLEAKGVNSGHGPRGDHFYRVAIVPPRPDRSENRRLLDRLEQGDPRRHLPFEPL